MEITEDKSPRTDIESAISSLESKPEVVAVVEPVVQEAAAPEVKQDAKQDEGTVGQDVAKAAVEVKAPTEEKVTAKVEPAKVEEAKPAEDPRWTERLAKAPPSWKPVSRELWEQVPHAARLEIHRRESETYKALQSSKDSRDFIGNFRQVVQPYALLLEQEGGPMQGFTNYLKTASILRMGTPHEKAMAVASAIQQFAIPIELLDAALAGVINPQQGAGAQQAGGAQFRDPRVDELLQTLSNSRQQRQAQDNQQVDQELGDFANDPANEFFQDVRNEMSDILEIAARKGQTMSLQQAYKRATMLNEDVARALEQRGLKGARQQAVDAAKKAKAASIQVSGSQSLGSVSPSATDSVRGAIETAIGQLSGR